MNGVVVSVEKPQMNADMLNSCGVGCLLLAGRSKRNKWEGLYLYEVIWNDGGEGRL